MTSKAIKQLRQVCVLQNTKFNCSKNVLSLVFCMYLESFLLLHLQGLFATLSLWKNCSQAMVAKDKTKLGSFVAST